MRNPLAAAVAIAGGVLILVDMFSPSAWLAPVAGWLLEAALVLGAGALLLGALHLVRRHSQRLAAGEPQSGYSALLLSALLITFGTGVLLPQGAQLDWIFGYLLAPLQGSMVALMCFVLVSALYRIGRLRQSGARGIVLGALLILLLQVLATVPLAPILPQLRDWLQQVLVMASARAMLLGAALGAAVAGLRVLTAVDQPYTQD
ncbi:MAG: hypothetical protein ACOX2L_08770 [Anaerolineae bacterium]|jgi:hypothetical protein|nr:hypothetical protein [Chloroflexota bacterium]